MSPGVTNRGPKDARFESRVSYTKVQKDAEPFAPTVTDMPRLFLGVVITLSWRLGSSTI
jgi:hypothetical protein